MQEKTASTVIGLIDEIIRREVGSGSVSDTYPLEYIDAVKELVAWQGDVSKDLRDVIAARNPEAYCIALISLHSTRNKIINLPHLSDARKDTLQSIIDTVITEVIRQAL